MDPGQDQRQEGTNEKRNETVDVRLIHFRVAWLLHQGVRIQWKSTPLAPDGYRQVSSNNQLDLLNSATPNVDNGEFKGGRPETLDFRNAPSNPTHSNQAKR